MFGTRVWYNGLVQGFGTRVWYKGLVQVFGNDLVQEFGGRASYKV
jgi:hypothetical protein